MRRIFTALTALTCMLIITTASAQTCLTGGSWTPVTTNTFSTTAEGFTGDFSWRNTGNGQLESTPTTDGTLKLLQSATYVFPASETTLAWSFTLSGTAQVTGYTVKARTYENGTFTNHTVCTGGSLSTTGSTLSFAAPAPVALQGKAYQLIIEFTVSGNGASTTKYVIVDNFAVNTNASAIILPVTISYFNAAASSGGILLTWLVAGESNVNRYEVERSANGKAFSKIGQVNASGSNQYTYKDMAYNTGSNYYRLKVVDNDGKVAYSKVVLYKVGRKGIQMKVYPMPAENEVTLEHATVEGKATIRVISLEGKVMSTIIPADGVQQTDLRISTLTPGLYIVRFENGDGSVEHIRIIKQ